VAKIYYRDESLTYYPFPTLSKGAVTSIGASQQKTDFYGGQITLNSQPTDDLTPTWGVDADHETFDANQQVFDLRKTEAHGGM
ncbi:TonB-dependent siderophore receptor, partial [Enterobacter hormaechei]|nr:TonB-dependent siderophore receptor [Enterobacter hormaechei]